MGLPNREDQQAQPQPSPLSPAELRPGDVYLVRSGGQVTEALITMLRITRHLEACGDQIVDGRRDSFWISAGTPVTVIRRDPAYENWRPEQPEHPLTPQQRTQPLEAGNGRRLLPATELNPGDIYLVCGVGQIAEAVIIRLYVPSPNYPSCRTGYHLLCGRTESFWIGGTALVVVTGHDPAYENWKPGSLQPPQQELAPENALAFDPDKFRRAFQAHGIMGCYVTGTWETRTGGTDIALIHTEHPSTVACWDLPGQFPHLVYDELPVHFPHLVVAQTACMADDLGQPDDLNPRSPQSDRRRYICRLGHVHRGQSPYGQEMPPEIATRISASLGEEPSP